VVSRAGSGEEGKDWDDLGQKIILNENICYWNLPLCCCSLNNVWWIFSHVNKSILK
jgi:hypothetical protein